MIERYQTLEMKNLFEESRRFDFMLQVEIAVAFSQAQRKIIPHQAAQVIARKSFVNYKKILKFEKKTKHDVIAFVQQVSEAVGDYSQYFHFGLTSSDVLDTALSLQINEAFNILLTDFYILKKTILKLAKEHQETICPGRTHGIYAEITTFGFKMMGFLSELSRVEVKLLNAQEQFKICKLSGAVGTSSALGHELEMDVARRLGLQVEPFATQVIPRDRHAEVFMSLSFLSSSLERLSIELRHLQRTEVSEVVEGFTPGQKGSSAMPHKKNPISAENITGLSRLIKGYAQVSMENIPLWHERDISHSSNERIMFQDSFTLSHYIVRRMNQLLEGLYIDQNNMLENTYKNQGKLYSSHVLNHLLTQGLSRDEAYTAIQKLSFGLTKNGSLENALRESVDLKQFFSDRDLKNIFSGQKHLQSILKRIKKYEKYI